MSDKDGARTHEQRSPDKAHGSGDEHRREDGDGPSDPKRLLVMALGVAEASEAPPADDAAGRALSPPRSALKRVGGAYDPFPVRRRAQLVVLRSQFGFDRSRPRIGAPR